MSDGQSELVAMVADQEARLVFDAFNEDTALDLGTRLLAKAKAEKAPVVIDIRSHNRTYFHAALPGSSPDQDLWARRKSNVVLHYHTSTYALQLSEKFKSFPIGPMRGLDPMDFIAAGGSFPVTVKGTGVIAVITVSGLKSEEDHGMIVDVLEEMLG